MFARWKDQLSQFTFVKDICFGWDARENRLSKKVGEANLAVRKIGRAVPKHLSAEYVSLAG